MQYFWLVVIVLVLVAMSIGFGWSQFRTLRWLKTQPGLSSEDRAYFRNRSFRRLFGCVLSAILAFQFSGFYFFGILDGLDNLIERSEKVRENGAEPNADMLDENDRDFLAFGRYYVGATGLVVIILMAIALADTMATRRYGMRHRKRIRDDRQAMLMRQLPLLRRNQNGRH